MKLSQQSKSSFGWIAIIVSAFFANAWAFWGIMENFHEGWYHPHFWDNIKMMFGQYLIIPIGFILLGSISLRWQKAGSVLHLILAVYAYYFFGKMNAGLFFISIPLIGLALMYWFAYFQYKKIAKVLMIYLPLSLLLLIGFYQGYKVSGRYNDHNVESRLISGNGVELIWAPEGPGWPDNGTNWEEAKKICSYLSEDGKTLSHQELNIWRLPSLEEAVASQVYRGKNAGGIWNTNTKTATYVFRPDKESPLWNVHKKTIYWWTSTEVDSAHAYIIVYNGGVFPRNKKVYVGYLNFRAVKDNFYRDSL